MNSSHQNNLLSLTIEKSFIEIKAYLENLPDTEKGQVFEWYLAELFRGNGWLVKEQGGRDDLGADALLYHPKSPSDVSLIVQAKNQANPISFDDTKIELIKFEEKAAPAYQCNQFIIVSINGFVRQAKELREFNMLLKEWDYVENLISSYDPINKTEPEIELYAHNEITYHKVKKFWEKDRNVAVVQATGTGKSYIIARIMADILAEGKLVMAPSKYILQQQLAKVPWATQSTTFMTYAKGATLDPDEISQLNCRLIVLDEFHRCGAEIWGAGVQRIIDAFPDAYILGTSATPIRFLDNNRDMSDELFDNHVAENISLAEAIERRILPSPTYISALYTLDEETEKLLAALESSRKAEIKKKELVQEIHKARLDWEKTSGIPEILKKHLKSEINKIIVFCRNEQHLDEMEAEVPRWFQKAKSHRWRKIYRVLSADSTSDRNLEEFRKAKHRDTIHLLFAIDMLNEGLHISDVGAVILLRPTESPIVFYQQIGRCIEVNTSRTPLIFDFVNNFKSIKAGNFLEDLEKCNEIQNVKRAAFGLSKRPLNIRIIDETREIEDVFNNIANQIQPFQVGLEHLKKFVHENGTSKVPSYHKTSSGFPLGAWVRSRRSDYRQGRLSIERTKTLEALPGWVWDGVEAYFQEGLENLKQFVKEHQHSGVRRRYKTPSGFDLGPWVIARRMEYRKGTLPETKINALEELPGWVWDAVEATFIEGVEHLKRYVQEYGDAQVKRNYKTSSGFTLGVWVNIRRNQYNKGILSAKRIQILESIEGWVWDPRKVHFQKGVELLKKYVSKHGNADVPPRHLTECGFKLGTWVSGRKAHFKNGQMSNDNMELLEAITGWTFEPDDTDFQEAFEHLKKYVEEKGNTEIPIRYKTSSGYKLGHWVIRKRKEYVRGLLSSKIIAEFEAIPQWSWDPKETQFKDGVRYLKQYAP